MENQLILKAPEKGQVFFEGKIGGSKSISNRFLIIRHYAESSCPVVNESDSEDTQLLKKNLKNIKTAGSSYIFCNHGGTTFRFLLPLLCSTPGKWILDGSERIRERPHEPLVHALLKLGADIRWKGKPVRPPFEIQGKPLCSIPLEIETSTSSQYLSALLMMAPCLPEGLQVHLCGKKVSEPYLQMTLSMMQHLGIRVKQEENDIQVFPGKYLLPEKYLVESDWSSASYWYNFLALSRGGKVTLSTFSENSLQGDSILPSFYEKLGLQTRFHQGKNILEIVRRKNDLSPSFLEFDLFRYPDLAMTLAVSCAGRKIPCRLRGLDTLNFKESERIRVMKEIFQNMGITVFADNNSLELKHFPEAFPEQLIIESFDDHRIILAFSGLSLIIPRIYLKRTHAINKSYPDFFNHLKEAGFSVTEVN